MKYLLLVLNLLFSAIVFSIDIGSVIGGGGFIGNEGSPPISSVKNAYDRINLTASVNASEEYLKKLISYYLSFQPPQEINKKFFQTTWLTDSTMGLLGYLNTGWYIQDDRGKSVNDYFAEVSEIASTVRGSYLKSDNFSEDKALSAIGAGLVASISYGHIFAPTRFKLGAVKAPYRTFFSFLVGQQKIRHATLIAHAQNIVLYKKELAYLYSLLDEYCDTDVFDFSPSTVPTPDKLVKGSGLLYYRPVVRAIENATESLLEGRKRQVKLECINYLIKLHTAKVNLELAELMLLNLATSYSILQNQEKQIIEVIGK